MTHAARVAVISKPHAFIKGIFQKGLYEGYGFYPAILPTRNVMAAQQRRLGKEQ